MVLRSHARRAHACLLYARWQISHEDALGEQTQFDAANRDFVAWLRRAGVALLRHRLSFYDLLPMKSRRKRTAKNPNLNVGAFGRLDMGLLVEAMRDELLTRGLDAERVLYTDTDVLFASDVNYAGLRAMPLPTFAAGTEVFSPALNSGVMLINATAWAAHYVAMVAYGQRKGFKFLSYDQTWVQGYFKHVAVQAGVSLEQAWAQLPDMEYNARGYMHPVHHHRRAPVLPRLWHWHGFKPPDVECWHRAIASGAWPVRAWRNTVPGCTGKTRPRCMFMPVHGSGCRYFGRLTAVLGMTPCYLRTYTYLLQQHRRMLAVAKALADADAAPTAEAPSPTTCAGKAAARAVAWDGVWQGVAARAKARSAELLRSSPSVMTTVASA